MGRGMYRLSNDSPKNPSQRQDASSPRIPVLGGDQQNQLLAGVFFPGKERTGQLQVQTLKAFIRLQTTLCTPVLLISHISPYLSPTLAVFPPKTKLKQSKQKPFFTSVFLTLLVRGEGAVVCYTFLQSASLSHWSGSRPLVSGTPLSLDPILQPLQVTEILLVLFHRTGPSTSSSRS